MLSWRARRQISVLALLLALAGGLGFWLVGRALPAPSCTDNRRNHGETDVDCGGPCASCELKNPRPLSIFWARFGRASGDAYDLAALVENVNQTLSSDLVQYEFTLLDAYGIIGQKRGTAYVYPGERLYIIEPNVKTTREAERVAFTVRRVAWQSKETGQPQLVVERRDHRTEVEGTDTHSVIEAQILNAGPQRYRRMDVHFLVFDDAGNLLGANRVVAEHIGPQERRVVSSRWPRAFSAPVARIEVYPRVNLFAPDALIKP